MIVRRGSRVGVITALLTMFLATVPSLPVNAAPIASLAVPASVTASYNNSLAITGVTLTAGGLTSIQVQLSVSHGTLSLSTTTGLSFVPGNGSGNATVQFTGSPTNVQAALNTLTYTPTTSYTGADTLTYNTSPGGGLYNPVNGHFYEFVDNGSTISWTAAKAAADVRTFGGITGYLATVTSQAEQDFVSSKLQGQGWFAASDAASESHWEWADGPENGQEFWEGTRDSGTCPVGPCAPVSGRYNNWADGEPNDASGEDYSHFLNNGEWNDYPVSAGIQKYLVEYGGNGGDPNPVDAQSTAITVAVTAPGLPTGVSLTRGNQQIEVSWTAPANTGGATIDVYLVEYSIDGGSTWVPTTTTSSTSKTITGLTNGTATQVRVSAHNSVGYGSTTTPASATPATTPSAPISVAATVDNTQTVVTWSAPTSTGGATITGYKVEYSSNGGSSYTVSSASTTSPRTITGLTNGTTYTIRVTPINAVGEGTAATTTVVPGTVPGAPSTPVLTVGNAQLSVTWSAPGSNGGHAIDVYLVEYSVNGGTTWIATSTTASTSKTVTGLINGTSTQVRVKAHNDIGYGAESSPSTAIPVTSPSGVVGLVVDRMPTKATISWSAPTDDGGTPITSYIVEYRLAGGTWTMLSSNATSPTVLDNLTPGTDYEVRVIAHNAVGDGVVTPNTFTTGTPPATGIVAPIYVSPTGTVIEVPVFNTTNPAQITSPTPTGEGSWSLTPDGGVFTAGDANFFGSMGGETLVAPAVGIAPTATGGGYFVVSSDGGVFAFGDAQFNGSMSGFPLNSPVKAIAPSCTDNGYYLVSGDGGVFAFGNAGFHGSMGGQQLNQEMIGIVDACGKQGYWTFARDGGVFSFGDAQFYGSLGANPPAGGVIGMVSAPDGNGYWLIGADRRAYGFGSVAN